MIAAMPVMRKTLKNFFIFPPDKNYFDFL